MSAVLEATEVTDRTGNVLAMSLLMDEFSYAADLRRAEITRILGAMRQGVRFTGALLTEDKRRRELPFDTDDEEDW